MSASAICVPAMAGGRCPRRRLVLEPVALPADNPPGYFREEERAGLIEREPGWPPPGSELPFQFAHGEIGKYADLGVLQPAMGGQAAELRGQGRRVGQDLDQTARAQILGHFI